MKALTHGAGVVLLACCTIVLAHTHLLKSVPADGQAVAAAPEKILLTFSEAARLTAAWIQKDEGARTRLTAPDKASKEVTLSLPALAPGAYVVSWRAASADGHLMPGRIRFTVSTGAASPGDRH